MKPSLLEISLLHSLHRPYYILFIFILLQKLHVFPGLSVSLTYTLFLLGLLMEEEVLHAAGLQCCC